MARGRVSVRLLPLLVALLVAVPVCAFASSFAAFTISALVPVPAVLPGARYGASVTSANGYVAVGAPGTAGGNGSVVIFDCRLSTCRAVQTLTPPDLPPITDPVPEGERPAFGSAVAMSNTLLLVGAPGWEVAYLYQCTVGATCTPLGAPLVKSAFVQQRRRGAAGRSGYEYDRFGETVAVGDGLAVVGASNSTEDGLGGPARGRAYTFACSVASGCAGDSESSLAPEASFDDDAFGKAVAYSQGLAVVGAPGAGNNGTQQGNGAVTVWSCADGDCTAKTPYTIPGPVAGSLFGAAVATHSGLVVVGSPALGRAYVYACVNVVGGPPVCTLQTTLAGSAADGFGQAVDVYLGTVAVGAPLAGAGDGAVFVYDCSLGAGVTVLLDTVRGVADSSEGMGTAAAIVSPTQVVVGSPQVATGGPGSVAYGFSKCVSARVRERKKAHGFRIISCWVASVCVGRCGDRAP
jgi:hypothetical protein